MSFKDITRGENTLLPFSVTLECESVFTLKDYLIHLCGIWSKLEKLCIVEGVLLLISVVNQKWDTFIFSDRGFSM